MATSVYMFIWAVFIASVLSDENTSLLLITDTHLDEPVKEAQKELSLEKRRFLQYNSECNETVETDTKKITPRVERLEESDDMVESVADRIAKRFFIEDNADKNVTEERVIPRTEFNTKIMCEQRVFQCNFKAKYRNVDGSCNNPNEPSLGLAVVPFDRLLPPVYGNEKANIRLSVTGNELPSARVVSSKVHPDVSREDPLVTHMVVAFGQFLGHDMTSTPDCQIKQCCKKSKRECLPIRIPNTDPVYGRLGISCFDFCRSIKACNSKPRNQINQATAFIDGSHIYGNSLNEQAQLRSFDKGKLYAGVNSKFLPENPQAPGCGAPKERNTCFRAGDNRVNENPMLTSMHTLFLREHNSIARNLRLLNAQWNDETIFQETKRIVVAELENIVFSEYLPIVLGNNAMNRNNLKLPSNGYTNYNINLRPNMINSFSTAAYRFGHTQIQNAFELFKSANVPLARNFENPTVIHQKSKNVERIILGLTQQSAQTVDNFMAEAVTSHLFQPANAQIGGDLASVNIHRGRDHGIPPYVQFRDYCSLDRPKTFNDLAKIGFDKEIIDSFSQVYADVDDIDLWSAGISEKPLKGSIVGPTFACILATQFNRVLYADRFFFTHGSQAGSFTADQLINLRQRTLGGIICDNVGMSSLTQVQRNVFLNSSQRNVAVSCRDQPKLDLNLWKQ